MAENLSFKLLKTLNHLQIRSYSDFIMATTLAGQNGNGEEQAVQRLRDYLSFDNKKNHYLGLFYPVLFYAKDKKTVVSMVVREQSSLKDIPAPKNSAIKLEKQKSRVLAVLKFYGRSTLKKVNKVKDRLFSQLMESRILVKGQPFLMRYKRNNLFPFLRKNEIAVEVLA